MAKKPLSKELIRLHANLCHALADPNRLQLLYALSDQHFTVSDLAAEIGITPSSASRNLKILRDRGLVQAYRRGASVVYQITDKRLIEVLDILHEFLCDKLITQAHLFETYQEYNNSG